MTNKFISTVKDMLGLVWISREKIDYLNVIHRLCAKMGAATNSDGNLTITAASR